jgi:hypothetical protein
MILAGSSAVAYENDTWRDRFNSENSIRFDSQYYVAWHTEEVFLGYNEDNMEVDEEGNIYSIVYDPEHEVHHLVSYDRNGNKRFESRGPGDPRYTIPVISEGGRIAFFSNTTFHLLDNDGEQIMERTFPAKNWSVSNPVFIEEDRIFFALSDEWTVTLYGIDDGGSIITESPVGIEFSPERTIPIPGGKYILEGNDHVALVREDGAVEWSYGILGYIYDIEVEGDRVHFSTCQTVHCLDMGGEVLWNFTFDDEYDIQRIVLDREGNLIVLARHFISGGGHGDLFKYGRDGHLVWTVPCTYAHKEMTIDSEGYLNVGGSQQIQRFDGEGNEVGRIVKDEVYYLSDPVILEDGAFLVTDCKRIVCLKPIPYEIILSTSEDIWGNIDLDIELKELPADQYPEIEGIELVVINMEHEAEVEDLPGDARKVRIDDHPDDRFMVRANLVLGDGETIQGPTINVTEKDRTSFYVAVWCMLSILPIAIIAIITSVVLLRIRKRSKG